jgi:hypothetical protein
METLNAITNGLLAILDVPLGWLLALPRGVAILIVAIGTSLILTICRKWTTNQEKLGRAKRDLDRLKQIRREAKREGDKERVKQVRMTVSMIQIMKVKAEGMPLLVSIVPVALLAIWAFSRLNYYAPQPDEPVVIEANFQPASLARGRLARLVAPPEVKVEAAIQVVEDDPKGDNGLAKWTVVPTEPAKDVTLLARYRDDEVPVTMDVGGNIYQPPIAFYAGKTEGITATQVHLEQATFFGVPGLHPIFLPAWLTWYLAITIVFVPLLRKWMKVN